jgi:hypothetical protein
VVLLNPILDLLNLFLIQKLIQLVIYKRTEFINE